MRCVRNPAPGARGAPRWSSLVHIAKLECTGSLGLRSALAPRRSVPTTKPRLALGLIVQGSVMGRGDANPTPSHSPSDTGMRFFYLPFRSLALINMIPHGSEASQSSCCAATPGDGHYANFVLGKLTEPHEGPHSWCAGRLHPGMLPFFPSIRRRQRPHCSV